MQSLMPTLDTKGPFMGDMEKQQENANCDFSSEYGLFLGDGSKIDPIIKAILIVEAFWKLSVIDNKFYI